MKRSLTSDSSQKTIAVGKVLGGLCKGGEIIGIKGELGAGKTCFVQGLAKGMGIGKDQYVSSPTFTIINEYSGKIPLYHFDLYRLESTLEIEDLGYEEYFYGKGVTAVEWFEKLEEITPKEMLSIEIRATGENSRELYFSCVGVYYRQVLKSFFEKVR